MTKDIPADDELVAMLTVTEAARGISPSVVTDSDVCPAAPAAGAAEVPSPVAVSRSPVSRGDDDGGGIVEGKTGEPSTRPVITAPPENSECTPCRAPGSSHHNVIDNSKKKDRTVHHSNLATTAALSSDVEQQRRSFCKYSVRMLFRYTGVL